MLLRDAQPGLEVFMLRRSSRSRFAPDAYVFPGGTVEAQDRANAEIEAAWLRHLFRMDGPPDPTLQRGIVAAALRELFEESRIRLSGARELELFSRWITPESEPQRYDVFFFVAAAPRAQQAEADMVETHDGMWLSPHEAVRRSDAAELYVVFPTRKHLERLQAFENVAGVMDFARTKPILTVTAKSTGQEAYGLPAEIENAW